MLGEEPKQWGRAMSRQKTYGSKRFRAADRSFDRMAEKIDRGVSPHHNPRINLVLAEDQAPSGAKSREAPPKFVDHKYRYPGIPREQENVMGTVTFWNPGREIGFVTLPGLTGSGKNGDFFVGVADVVGFKTPPLSEGDEVMVDVIKEPISGLLRAIHVRSF